IPPRCRKTNPRIYYFPTTLLQCSPVRMQHQLNKEPPTYTERCCPYTHQNKKYEHISPVLASLHWLPVKSRIDFKVLLLTYKALNYLAPNYLKELVVPYCPPRPLRSQSAGLLVIPRISKTTIGGRVF